MRQQVNLYQPSFRPKKIVLSSRAMLGAVLTLVAGLTAFSAYALHQAQGVNDGVDELTRLRDQRAQRLQQLSAERPPRTKSQVLVQELERLNTEIGVKERVLAQLGRGADGNTAGFGDHLEGLARQHHDGLWLSALSIEAGGAALRISGSALRPESVPQYLQQLAHEPAYRGHEFRGFEVFRPATAANHVDFVLSTRPHADTPAP